ncbi:MAG: inositol-3-phosphate synthase [Candidatus Bathyarchaeota archaeon]|nr:MAG: inositol-3-phosphate synthase [Candidatus Bathyarchaeota archaeon]
MAKIKVGLAGIGNCASGFVQGLSYYKNPKNQKDSIGLRQTFLAGYHPKDIEVVAAFDVDARKIGKDLSAAIFSEPNNTLKFAEVPELGVSVHKGQVLDGLGSYLKDVIKVGASPAASASQVLKETDAEMLVSLLPGGAAKATQWYAKEALHAGCAFINVTPVRIASDSTWDEQFRNAKLPVVGDDLIDQIGATTLHKMLIKLLDEQGVRISETYQLDVGGGTESLDTLERSRDTKRIAKTKTIRTTLPYETSIVAGTTDYVDFLRNRRDSYLWIKGMYFGKAPMEMELRLCTVDGPNAGSVLLDVIRAVKVALERGESGAIQSISAFAFKHPPEIVSFRRAAQLFKKFLFEK